jgi:hypothetical protein
MRHHFPGSRLLMPLKVEMPPARMHHADHLAAWQLLVHDIDILRPDIVEPGSGCVAYPEEIHRHVRKHFVWCRRH